MNVKKYILTGVIESYVLGLSTETEQQEFEVGPITMQGSYCPRLFLLVQRSLFH